jgi:MFS family permease
LALKTLQSLSFTMGYGTLWRKLSASQLNIAIQAFALISIFFEGYDQGVMGGVNSSPRYVQEVGIGTSDGHITDTLHEGGIVSIYYLGCIVGCFIGGWLADRIGRINGLVALEQFLSCVNFQLTFLVFGSVLSSL